MQCETQYHDEDIPAQPRTLLFCIFYKQLASNEEADSDRSQVDDPSRDPHHHFADTLKKLLERPGVLAGDGDGDSCHDAEHDEAKLR